MMRTLPKVHTDGKEYREPQGMKRFFRRMVDLL